MRRALRKLRKTSFDELFVRGSQLLSAFAERQAWPGSAKLISDDELLDRIDFTQLRRTALPSAPSVLDLRDHFRERLSPHFFPAFEAPDSTVAQFRQRWPELQKKIVERAEKI